jgi:hypothetical protein
MPTIYHDEIRRAIAAVRDTRGTREHTQALANLAALIRACIKAEGGDQ